MLRKLLNLDEARTAVRGHTKAEPLGREEIPLSEAHDRVLAENVTAGLDVPSFDRSTVDGYAVRAEDTYGAEEKRPLKLAVHGLATIGEPPRMKVTKGTAAEIVTGAPIPDGADAVVMLEDVERTGSVLNIASAVVSDENIMKAGSDLKRGQVALEASVRLGSREIGVLAAIGQAEVRVYTVPRVAVLSTGGEVTEPGRKLRKGGIYDTNAYSLSAAVVESGGKPIRFGVVADDRAELEKALRRALSSADIVVTSGGVSVGPKDLVPQVVDSMGKPGVVFSGVAIKPGKPVTFALVGGKPVFSLPGHPTSALLVFHLLVRPVVAGMAGRTATEAPKVKATAGMKMFPAKGRRTFVMVALRRDKRGGLMADPVESGASGAITTLAKADGYVEIAENVQFVDAGEEVSVRLFRNYREGEFLAL